LFWGRKGGESGCTVLDGGMECEQLHDGGGNAARGLAKVGEEAAYIELLLWTAFANVRAGHDVNMALVQHRLSCLSVRLELEFLIGLARTSFAVLVVDKRLV